MVGFERDEYTCQVKTAYANREKLQSLAESLAKKEFKRIVFVGIGGTLAMPMLIEGLFKQNTFLEVRTENAKELLLTDNGRIDKDTLCIFASRSGTTKETVEVGHYCHEQGAYCLGFVGDITETFEEFCDEVILLTATNDTFLEPLTVAMLIFGMHFVNCLGEVKFDKYGEFMEGITQLPDALCRVREEYDATANEFVKKNVDTNYYMITGAGNTWGLAYGYGMCVLEEMQWIPTKTIHAAEFFHGTLEIMDENTRLIVFRGEDDSQCLCDRVTNFAKKVTKHVLVLDTREYELPGIPQEYRKYLSPLVIQGMLDRLSAHLEVERNHPLHVQRYYRVVEY